MLEELGKFGEIGVTALALIFGIYLVDLFRKKYRESEPGDRRTKLQVVGCPNKIEGMAEILDGIRRALGTLTQESAANRDIQTEQLRVLQHVSEGTDRLVEQHKAGPDGVEMWKVSPHMLKLQQESRDLLRDIVNAVERGNGT
jgi:hypothetical protein